MTGLNHAITGAVVAVAIKQPLLALPAAFLSHFIIDMLPHWDYKVPGLTRNRHVVIAFDLAISSWLIVLLTLLVPEHGYLAFFGGFLGIAPDIMWLPYILHGRPSPMTKKSLLHRSRRFHHKIQWSESARGLAFEVLWFGLMIFCLIKVTS